MAEATRKRTRHLCFMGFVSGSLRRRDLLAHHAETDVAHAQRGPVVAEPRRHALERSRLIPPAAAHNGKTTRNAALPLAALGRAETTTAVRAAPETLPPAAPLATAGPSTPAAPIGCRSRRINCGAVAVVVRRIEIRHPLAHVALHVVQAPRVRLLLPHGMGFVVGVGGVPRHLIERAGVRFVLARTRGILPFRFGGKPVAVTIASRIELRDEVL